MIGEAEIGTLCCRRLSAWHRPPWADRDRNRERAFICSPSTLIDSPCSGRDLKTVFPRRIFFFNELYAACVKMSFH